MHPALPLSTIVHVLALCVLLTFTENTVALPGVRYVRINGQGGDCFTLSTVQVFSCDPTLGDLALGKSATQTGYNSFDCNCVSSSSRGPSVPISGNPASCAAGYSSTSCTSSTPQHWQVDLGGTYDICRVNILQGTRNNAASIVFYSPSFNVLGSANVGASYALLATCTASSCSASAQSCTTCTNAGDCNSRATSVSGSRPACTCVCSANYLGPSCSTRYCVSSDCNAAHTITVSGTFPACNCRCRKGYYGSRCDNTFTTSLSRTKEVSLSVSADLTKTETVSHDLTVSTSEEWSRSESQSNPSSSTCTVSPSAFTPSIERSGSLSGPMTSSLTLSDKGSSTASAEDTASGDTLTESDSPSILHSVSTSFSWSNTSRRSATCTVSASEERVQTISTSPTLENVTFHVDPWLYDLDKLKTYGATVRVSIHGDKFLAGLVGHSPAGCVSLSVGPIPQLGNGTLMAALQRAAELMTADVVVNVTSSGNMTVLLPPENATAPLVSRYRVPLQVVVAARCIGRQELADDERTMSFLLIPNVDPTISPTQEALAIVGGVVGGVLSPSVAIQSTRALFDLSLTTCALEEDELSTLDSPLGYVYGEGRARYYVGGAIGNTLVLGLWLLGHMGVVVACMLWQRRRRVASGSEPLPPRQQFVDGCRAARFPSVVMMPWLLLLQPTVTSGVAGATATDDGFEIAVCAAVLLLWALSPLVLVVVLRPLRQRVELVPSDEAHDPDWRSRYSRFAEGDLMWRDMPEHEAARYLTRYRMLFVEYNARLPQFLAIDSGVSIVMGFISGLRGIMDGKCAALAGVCVSVLLTLLCLTVWIRPYRGQLSFWYSIGAVTLQLGSAVMTFVFLLLRQDDRAQESQDVLQNVIDIFVTVQLIVTLIRVFLDVLSRIRRFFDRYRRQMLTGSVAPVVRVVRDDSDVELLPVLRDKSSLHASSVRSDGMAPLYLLTEQSKDSFLLDEDEAPAIPVYEEQPERFALVSVTSEESVFIPELPPIVRPSEAIETEELRDPYTGKRWAPLRTNELLGSSASSSSFSIEDQLL